MNSGLAKVGKTAQDTFKNIQKDMEAAKKKNDTLSSSYKDLEKSIKEYENILKTSTSKNEIAKTISELKKLKKEAAKHPANLESKETAENKSGGGGGFWKSIAGSVAGVFSKGNLAALGGMMLSGGMKQQKDIASLQPSLGKEGAAAAYSNIKKDAAATPFDTDSLLQVNKSLLQAGASAGDARLDALALGNAVASMGGGNEQLTKMAELMAQIKTAGGAGSDELKKFADGGVDIYKALAAATGKSVEETKNMNVSYDQLSAALRTAGAEGGVFAGAMANQNQTVEAKWGNLTESLTTGLGDVGIAFMPIVQRLLDFGLKLTNTLLPQIMQFVQPVMDILNSLPIESILNDVMSMVSAILAAVGPILAELQPLFETLLETLGPLISQVSAFIVSLVQQLAPILAVIANILAAVLGPAVKIVGAILGWVITGISKAVDFIMPILKAIVDFISEVVDAIMWVLNLDTDKNNIKPLTTKPLHTATKPKESTVSATDAAVIKGTGLAQVNNNLKTPQNVQQGQAGKTAGEIAGGGPRVININGVKFTDKVELHILNVKEGVHELETMLEEMFLRILNTYPH